MRRFTSLVCVVAVLVVGLVALSGLVPGARAHDATPPPGGFEIAPGVTAELLPTADDPPSLYRLRFAAGVTYPFEGDPSLVVAYVESGTLTFRCDAPVTVARVDATGTPGEPVAAGTEFTVTAGGYFVLPPFVSGEVRNDGSESGAMSVAGIIPGEIATPTAGTPAA
ncbi:MAG: hypothetical protein M3462_05795 [Chloroflexota bacterium]|nr:hypothetical protein [Chloroflexota bacterium]